MTSNSKYWGERFTEGKCYRDFYCGKGHFLVKAFLFFVEGIEAGEMCLFCGIWFRDLMLLLKSNNYKTEELKKNQQIILLDNLHHKIISDIDHFNNTVINPIHEKVIASSFKTARIFWQIHDYHSSFYNDTFSSEIALKIDNCLANKNIFILFLCNFDAYTSRRKILNLNPGKIMELWHNFSLYIIPAIPGKIA